MNEEIWKIVINILLYSLQRHDVFNELEAVEDLLQYSQPYVRTFSSLIGFWLPAIQILILDTYSFQHRTRYNFIQVTHFLNAIICQTAAMFFQHGIDFISETILNIRVQCQLVKTEVHGRSRGLKSSSNEHECLCCQLFSRKCGVAYRKKRSKL